MSQASDLNYDESVLGVEVEVAQFTLTMGDIRAFCEVIGDFNPLYVDEKAAAEGPYGVIIAPPMLSIVLGANLGLDPKVQFGNRSTGGGRRCEFFEPVRAGDTVTVYSTVDRIFEKTGRSGRMVFVIRKVTFKNQHEETVATAEMALIHSNSEND
jgi:3-hydroxybutyryl-CoA dehydratase